MSEFIHEDIEKLKMSDLSLVAGGVGTAPVYPQVKWFIEHGLDVDVIIGINKEAINGWSSKKYVDYPRHWRIRELGRSGKTEAEVVTKIADITSVSAITGNRDVKKRKAPWMVLNTAHLVSALTKTQRSSFC